MVIKVTSIEWDSSTYIRVATTVDEGFCDVIAIRYYARVNHAWVRRFRLYPLTDGVSTHPEYKKIRAEIVDAINKWLGPEKSSYA